MAARKAGKAGRDGREDHGLSIAAAAGGDSGAGSHVGRARPGLRGTSGDDVLDGTDGADRIEGKAGDDVLNGLDGDDRLDGGKGDDTIDGGGGDDRIKGGKGDDTIDGGDGDDRIKGGKGDDTIDGGDGDDRIKGGQGDDTIDGGDGDDVIAGGAGADVMSGGAGSDMVLGGRGDDTATYDMAESLGAWDVYDGGAGADHLVLELTGGEWADPGVQADLAAFADFLAAHADSTRSDGPAFAFTAFHLDASNWETFEVVLVNTAPVAADDAAATTEDAAIDLDVLANDSDTDHLDALSVSAFDGTSALGATILLNGDGTLRYDPTAALESLAAGEVATDTFSYTVTDLLGATDTATVTVTVVGVDGGVGVNDAPVIEAAAAGRIVIAEGEAASITGLFSDPDLGDTHEVTIDWGDGTAAETAALAAGEFEISGSHVYGDDGVYTVTLTVADDGGATTGDSLTVTVLNLAPVAGDDSAALDEDGTIALDVLANDRDVAADLPLALTAVTQGAHGVVSIDAGGTLTYTPDADYHGADSFTYTVSDGDGGFDTATVSVTVNPVDDAPEMADAFTFAIDEGLPPATLVGTIDAADIDTGDTLAYSITAGNGSGVFAIDAATGAITTTAALDFEAVPGYTLTVQAMDGGAWPPPRP